MPDTQPSKVDGWPRKRTNERTDEIHNIAVINGLSSSKARKKRAEFTADNNFCCFHEEKHCSAHKTNSAADD